MNTTNNKQGLKSGEKKMRCCARKALESINKVKEKYPSVKIAIISCFEEGIKMFAGCDYSWYLFSEGGPWSAYYPSKANSLCPAKNKDEAIDIIGVPHLNRDMLMIKSIYSM